MTWCKNQNQWILTKSENLPTLVHTYQNDIRKDDIYSILKHMVVSMVKPRWLLQIYAWNVSIVDSTWP
jgi:hypothetical protein